jgi:hypothetical protein
MWPPPKFPTFYLAPRKVNHRNPEKEHIANLEQIEYALSNIKRPLSIVCRQGESPP